MDIFQIYKTVWSRSIAMDYERKDGSSKEQLIEKKNWI
jgi:hypothetical protein